MATHAPDSDTPYNIQSELEELSQLLIRKRQAAGDHAGALRIAQLRAHKSEEESDLHELPLAPSTKAELLAYIHFDYHHRLEQLYTHAHGMDRRLTYTQYLRTFHQVASSTSQGEAMEEFEREYERSRREEEPKEWPF